ncbi:XRE family transcriptional regulator [Aeromonas media]|uniref:XRE family transcriptional regulator n=1 Tax=Aeromonas media TaxID=651 RepID=UPI002B47A019|nr:XRE family transcriptional regulator [Aeromonas media]
MIKNDKQLALTKRKIEEFNAVITTLDKGGDHVHPLLLAAQKNAILSQVNDLELQVEEYESLLSKDYAVFDVDNIADLPKALIRARIYMRLTQKDLADRLGMKEQQIQRYENTEYSSASFSTLLSIVDALDLKIKEGVFLPRESRDKNILIEKLKTIGFDSTFIDKRIAPRDISSLDYSSWIERVCKRLNTIFGWSKDAILGDAPLSMGRDGSLVARFKMPVGVNSNNVTAYTQYAYSFAKIIASNFYLEQRPISSDANKVRGEILRDYAEVNFSTILNYAYDHGVAVVGLNDSKAFHGATWRIEHRNVIILKQKNSHAARWAFDLLHEMYHASQRPELKEFSIIELSETSDDRRMDAEEIEANEFASRVLLGDRADEYISMCFEKAAGKISWLKNAVQQVAEAEGLDCGVLAYQVVNKHEQLEKAQGRRSTWWGTASNLQNNDIDPKSMCIEKLRDNIFLEGMDEFEREFFEQAISL